MKQFLFFLLVPLAQAQLAIQLGTPASGVATNITGLPVSTGISGLGTGIAAWLAVPSGANFASALTTPVPAGAGGTGVANTATLTLGSSNQNWAALGTGLVKNTTVTGALSNAATADVCNLLTLTGAVTSSTSCASAIAGVSATVDLVTTGSGVLGQVKSSKVTLTPPTTAWTIAPAADNQTTTLPTGLLLAATNLNAGPLLLGPPVAGFNAFDQATLAATRNYSSCLDYTSTFQSCNVALAEFSTVTTANFSGGLYGQGTAQNATGTIPFLYGTWGEVDTIGVGTVATGAGLGTTSEAHSGSHVTTLWGSAHHVLADSGSIVTTTIGIGLRQMLNAGTVTTSVGLYLPDITGATTNYAIQTALGWNHFGDVTSMQKAGAGTPAKPNNALYVLGGSGTGAVSVGQLSDATGFGGINFSNTSIAIGNYMIASDTTDLRLNSPAGTVITAINNTTVMSVQSGGVAFAQPIGLFSVAFASLGTVPAAGIAKYCTNCTTAATCNSGGSGHTATSNGTNWTCQ